MSTPRKGLKSTTNNSPSPVTEHSRNYKNNNKKQLNKNICPFACPTCQSLGDLVKTKYEIINILSDTGNSIYSPMHELYYDDDDYRSIRNGKIFLSADFVDSLLQQNSKK